MNRIPTCNYLMAKQYAAMKKIVIEKLEDAMEEAIVDPTIKYADIGFRIPHPLAQELVTKGYKIRYKKKTKKNKLSSSSIYTRIYWDKGI